MTTQLLALTWFAVTHTLVHTQLKKKHVDGLLNFCPCEDSSVLLSCSYFSLCLNLRGVKFGQPFSGTLSCCILSRWRRFSSSFLLTWGKSASEMVGQKAGLVGKNPAFVFKDNTRQLVTTGDLKWKWGFRSFQITQKFTPHCSVYCWKVDSYFEMERKQNWETSYFPVFRLNKESGYSSCRRPRGERLPSCMATLSHIGYIPMSGGGVCEHTLDVIVQSYTCKLVIPVAWSLIHSNLNKEIYWKGSKTYFPKSNRCPHHSGFKTYQRRESPRKRSATTVNDDDISTCINWTQPGMRFINIEREKWSEDNGCVLIAPTLFVHKSRPCKSSTFLFKPQLFPANSSQLMTDDWCTRLLTFVSQFISLWSPNALDTLWYGARSQ